MLCGPAESSLAKLAYGGKIVTQEGTLMDTESRVSRKKEFIPVLASSIQEGWNYDRSTKTRGSDFEDVQEEELGYLDIHQTDPYGQIQRMGSSLRLRSATDFLMVEE